MTLLHVVNFNVKMALAVSSLLSIYFKFSYRIIMTVFFDVFPTAIQLFNQILFV